MIDGSAEEKLQAIRNLMLTPLETIKIYRFLLKRSLESEISGELLEKILGYLDEISQAEADLRNLREEMTSV